MDTSTENLLHTPNADEELNEETAKQISTEILSKHRRIQQTKKFYAFDRQKSHELHNIFFRSVFFHVRHEFSMCSELFELSTSFCMVKNSKSNENRTRVLDPEKSEFMCVCDLEWNKELVLLVVGFTWMFLCTKVCVCWRTTAEKCQYLSVYFFLFYFLKIFVKFKRKHKFRHFCLAFCLVNLRPFTRTEHSSRYTTVQKWTMTTAAVAVVAVATTITLESKSKFAKIVELWK